MCLVQTYVQTDMGILLYISTHVVKFIVHLSHKRKFILKCHFEQVIFEFPCRRQKDEQQKKHIVLQLQLRSYLSQYTLTYLTLRDERYSIPLAI